jgi:hypothetical protein
MTETIPPPPQNLPKYPAIVVAVIDEHRIVINRGSRDGLKPNTRLVIYGLSKDDVMDPETGETLGKLEIVRGLGTVVHLQESMATVQSVLKEVAPRTVIRRRSPFAAIAGMSTEEETIRESPETLPFDNAQKGDFARPV